jgi:hypothetical protein
VYRGLIDIYQVYRSMVKWIFALLIYGDWSPKRCRNIAPISSNFCLQTIVTFLYNFRYVVNFE